MGDLHVLVYTFLYGVGWCDCIFFDTVVLRGLVCMCSRSLSTILSCQGHILSALGVDFHACGCYIIYITGVIWNDWLLALRPCFCRDSDNAFMGAISLRLHLLYRPASLDRCAICWLPCTFWLLITTKSYRRTVYVYKYWQSYWLFSCNYVDRYDLHADGMVTLYTTHYI